MPEFPVVPPHEAGKQIRVLANQLYEVLSKPPSADHQTFQTTIALDDAFVRVKHAQHELDKAIESRRVTRLRIAAIEYREAVRIHRNTIYVEATNQLGMKKTSYGETKNGLTIPQAIKRLRDLANNLPTQPDMPSADSRDTALRAIIAVLRTHQIPGSEKLTHQAKEDTSGKTGETVGGTAPADTVKVDTPTAIQAKVDLGSLNAIIKP